MHGNTTATKQHHFKYNILTNYESIYFSIGCLVRMQNCCDRLFDCLFDAHLDEWLSNCTEKVSWNRFKPFFG